MVRYQARYTICNNVIVRDLLLEIKASSDGEPYRLIATGVRPIGGSVLFSPSEPVPSELLRALNRYLDEFDPGVGTWSHTVGRTTYQVAFTLAPSNQ
jgi:hypothetical protein